MPALAPINRVFNKGKTRFPRAEMKALYARGFHLIPCGGEDGKKPLRSNWNNAAYKRMPLKAVIDVMRRNNSCAYGIRLDRHCVVDCDTWNEETQALVEKAIPGTLLRVGNKRGKHFYFAPGEAPPANIKTGHIQIDFKAGTGHFVLGPGSQRPDGGYYESSIPNLNFLPELPDFRWKIREKITGDPARDVEALSGKIPIGNRNKWLSSQAAIIARDSVDQNDLLEQLKTRSDVWFTSHKDFPESEFRKIANWAWGLRCQNQLYGGRNSTFGINRTVLDILQPYGPKSTNAYYLYSVLVSNHGHIPNARFPICAMAMCNANLLPFKKSAADAAKHTLLSAGLIRRVQIGGFKEAHIYQLVNPSLFVEQP